MWHKYFIVGSFMNKFIFKFQALFLMTILLFSCSKNENFNPSFEQFSTNLEIKETEECSKECIKFKKEFRYIIYVAEKMYCYWDEKQAEYNLDIKKQALELENKITDTTSATSYFLLLTKLAALFKDGHVNVFMKNDMSDLEFYQVDLRLEVLAPGTNHEKLIVSNVGSGITNLKIGTEITNIQGLPWKDYVNEAEKQVSGSTLQMRRKKIGNSIFSVLLEKEGPKSIKVEGLYNNVAVSETVTRNLSLYDGAPEENEPIETGINLIKSSILDNNIGYLRIDGFSGSKLSALLEQTMDRLSGTSGLIIDVRKNGGGNPFENTILARLANKPIVRYFQRINTSDILQALRPNILIDYEIGAEKLSKIRPRIVKPIEKEKQYNKPVLVLTSASCFSACDTFVSAIKENKLGTIMGETTGGGTGNPQHINLPYSEHTFRFSVAQGFTAVGKKIIEGIGTEPDVLLEPTVEERVQQKDKQLQTALEYLSNKLKNSDVNIPSAVASLPDSLLFVKAESLDKPYEIELDKELRKSSD